MKNAEKSMEPLSVHDRFHDSFHCHLVITRRKQNNIKHTIKNWVKNVDTIDETSSEVDLKRGHPNMQKNQVLLIGQSISKSSSVE